MARYGKEGRGGEKERRRDRRGEGSKRGEGTGEVREVREEKGQER